MILSILWLVMAALGVGVLAIFDVFKNVGIVIGLFLFLFIVGAFIFTADIMI